MSPPTFDSADLQAFLSAFGAGELQEWRPLESPKGERRFFVLAGDERYVATVYEAATAEELSSAAALSAALARRGVPCPQPVPGPRGFVERLGGRPALLAPLLGGCSLSAPGAAHLAVLGAALARLHLAGEGLPLSGRGPHLSGVLCPLARRAAERLREVDPESAELLRAEADFQERVPEEALPTGLVHGALLTRNVLFREEAEGPRIAGFLAFEESGRGPWLFDLALVLAEAAWAGQGISGESARALLAGYRDVRPLEAAEFALLPDYLRRAALRLLCLRLEARSVRGSRGGGESAGEADPGPSFAKLRLLRAGLQGAAGFAAKAA